MKIWRFRYEMQLSFDSPVREHHYKFRVLPMETDAQTVCELTYGMEPEGSLRERTDGFGNRICYGELLKPHDRLRIWAEGTVQTGEAADSEEAGAGGKAAEGTVRTGKAANGERPETGGGAAKAAGDRVSGGADNAAAERADRGVADETAGKARGSVWDRADGTCEWMYRYPTPLTEADERLKEFLREIKEDYNRRQRKSSQIGGGQAADGLPADASSSLGFLRAVMHALYGRFSYVPGSTRVDTAAADAFAGGRGVCQDYTHIFITLCRLAGYPSRYVAGMTPGEGETHAWAEVLADGRWISFDPTHDRLAGHDCIKLSHGRDSKDCSVNRGCFIGDSRQRQHIYVKVEEVDK